MRRELDDAELENECAVMFECLRTYAARHQLPVGFVLIVTSGCRSSLCSTTPPESTAQLLRITAQVVEDSSDADWCVLDTPKH